MFSMSICLRFSLDMAIGRLIRGESLQAGRRLHESSVSSPLLLQPVGDAQEREKAAQDREY